MLLALSRSAGAPVILNSTATIDSPDISAELLEKLSLLEARTTT